MTSKANHVQLEFRQITSRVWATLGSSGNWYTLRLVDGAISCNCPASLHGKPCYHVKQLTALLKQELNEGLIAVLGVIEPGLTELEMSKLNISNTGSFIPESGSLDCCNCSEFAAPIDRSDYFTHSIRLTAPASQPLTSANSLDVAMNNASQPDQTIKPNQSITSALFSNRPNISPNRSDRLSKILAIVEQNKQKRQAKSDRRNLAAKTNKVSRVVRRKCHPP
jgi:hypothetical protein